MVLIDTREQDNLHIIKEFKKLNIDYCDCLNEVGDYMSINSNVCIERKKT